MSGESTEAPKLLELSIEYDRESVLYAKDHFTLYISVKNKSQKKITLWDFNIMGSSEFYLQTFFKKTGHVEGLSAGTWGTKIITFFKNFFKYPRNDDELFFDMDQKNLYLFCWNEITEKDKVQLKNYLKMNYCFDWVEEANIKKIDYKTIEVFNIQNKLSLKLNDEKNEVNIEIDDCIINKLLAIKENSNINIYKNPCEETLKKRARKDILQVHYYSRLKKPIINHLPWQLLPGECHTVNFDVETKHNWLFIPGTYKLNLYADYSTIENKFLFCWDAVLKNDTTLLKDFLLTDYKIDWIKDANIEKSDCDMAIIAKSKEKPPTNSLTLRLNETKTKVFLEINNCNIDQLIAIKENSTVKIYGETKHEEFARITKIEKVEVLVPLITLMWGGAVGATIGAIARISITKPQNILDTKFFLLNVFEIFVSIILSIVAVTALARRTGTQTIITIQDSWGGLLIGFMAGYAGHDYINTLLGIEPGEVLTNQTENVTNQISTLTDQTNNLTNQVSNLIDQINSSQ